jgi:hypothetical protein
MSTAHALPSAAIAPWAELVSTPGPVTVDILLTLPDDGYMYEVVEGVLVRVAGSGDRATTREADSYHRRRAGWRERHPWVLVPRG